MKRGEPYAMQYSESFEEQTSIILLEMLSQSGTE